MPVTLTSHGLQIDGREVPVYSGSVHYWRLERERWPLILDQVAALGFGMVETYIPWSIHETSPGVYDWGQVDSRKDFEAFMRLCEERGLWLLVRPGPLINAELTDFGFPEWVLLDERVQARTALGSLHLDAAWGLHPPRPFPVPSYASEAFYGYVAGWLDIVCPLLARHLAPRGCVVAVQSDNETCYMFHDQPYATDYSDDSLALYRRFLAERYSDIAALNTAYSSCYDKFSAIEPPRDCEVVTRADLPWHLDWVAYKEYQITWSVARIARMLRERGLADVPIFHDVAFQYYTPLDIAALEAEPDVDWVGMNLYANKEDYHGASARMRYLAGATKLPFVPEFGCGLWSHHQRTFMPDEHEFITLSALMHGLKAINFYMLVERERWQGSPITRHGTLRPDYAPFYARLSDFLRRYPLWSFERERAALLLLNYDLGRYVALASTLNYAHTDLYGLPAALFEVDLDLGLCRDPRVEASLVTPESWLATLGRGLAARGLDYDLADTHAGAERLARYPLLALQSVDFLDQRDQYRLLDYVKLGGHLLLGPELPTLDPALQPCRVLAAHLDAPGTVQVGCGRLTWAATQSLDTLLDELALDAPFRCAHSAVELAIHHGGSVTLLFAANPTDTPITSQFLFEGRRTLTPVWGDGPALGGEGAIEVILPAYSVAIWDAA
jgi:beta-galactosidase